MKHRAVICMLDGTRRHGTVEEAVKEHLAAMSSGEMSVQDKQLYFESDMGDQRIVLKMDSVKAIYLGAEGDWESHASPRFFDSAPIPSSLWVRAVFVDGEIVEGMIANAWSAFSGALLELHLAGEQFDQKQVLIPRASIAELQVITIR